MSVLVPCIVGVIGLVGVLTFAPRPILVHAQEASLNPIVYPEEPHAVSSPLSELQPVPAATATEEAPYQIPWRRTGPAGVMPEGVTDPSSIQTAVLPLIMTTNLLSFDGVANSANPYQVAPPDPNSAVGATQVFEMVNISYQIFNKSTGASVSGPNRLYQIWTNLYQQYGTVCGTPTNANPPAYYADPVVSYDALAGRWHVPVCWCMGWWILTCT